MENILASLNDWRQTTEFAAALPWLRVIVGGLMWGAFMLAAALITRDDLLADIRAALRLAGYSDKQVAADLGINKGLCSQKLSGARPMTIDALAHLPVEFWQWFAVSVSQRVGIPETVMAGARLARQARMTLPADADKERAS